MEYVLPGPRGTKIHAHQHGPTGRDPLSASHLPTHVLATGTGLGGQHSISGASAGYVLVAGGSTSASWTQLQHNQLAGITGSDHHASVTLAASADTLLGLSGQSISLDNQASLTMLAGPTSGAAASPTFRALTSGDLPAHDMLTKHTYSGGAALDVFGLSGASVPAKLTPSSDPGSAASLLCTDGSGVLNLPRVNATRSLHVGSTTDPGSRNLIVDGNITTSHAVSIADDAVYSWTPGSTTGMVLIGHGASTYTTAWGMAVYRTVATVFTTSMLASANFNVATGALTGTTGTDGKITFSAHSDGKCYIENRLGLTIGVNIVTLG